MRPSVELRRFLAAWALALAWNAAARAADWTAAERPGGPPKIELRIRPRSAPRRDPAVRPAQAVEDVEPAAADEPGSGEPGAGQPDDGEPAPLDVGRESPPGQSSLSPLRPPATRPAELPTPDLPPGAFQPSGPMRTGPTPDVWSNAPPDVVDPRQAGPGWRVAPDDTTEWVMLDSGHPGLLGFGLLDRPVLHNFRQWLADLLPVVSERWGERTLYGGLFLGPFFGDDLIDGRVVRTTGVIGGGRLGWDWSDYWGTEARAAFASADVRNATAPFLDRNGQTKFFDASLMFYPLSTRRFRPFLQLGFGLALFDFKNETGAAIVDSVFAFPVGGGFKYRFDDWVAFRLDVVDTVALGDNRLLSNTHNLGLTMGVEFRFGGPRRTYWPWNQRWWW